MKKIAQYTNSIQTILGTIVIVITLLLNNHTQAQSLTVREGFNNIENTTHTFENFKAKTINNKVYFMLLIHEKQEGSKYTLEVTNGNGKYIEIKSKTGLKSPENVPLLYCFTADVNHADSIYRIKRQVGFDISYSESIEVGFSNNIELTDNSYNQ